MRPRTSCSLLFGLFLAGAALTGVLLLRTPTFTVGVLYSDYPSFLATEADMLSTAQAYVDWYNERGGSVRLRLVASPFNLDPEAAFEELRRHGAAVVLGGSLSELAESALPHAARHRIPFVSPTAQTESVQGLDDWFFRVQMSLNRTTERTVALLRHLQADRVVAFVSRRNEAYGLETVRRTRDVAGIPFEIIDAEGDVRARRDWMTGQEAPSVAWIVATPETSYWLCHLVRSHWPETTLLLSIWSLSSGHERLDDIGGLSFYFVENYDPWLEEKRGVDPFRDAVRRSYSRSLSMIFHYTTAAMNLIAAAAEESPWARGEALRRNLAPRTVRSPGWTVTLDGWGDPIGRPRIFRRGPEGVEEVLLP